MASPSRWWILQRYLIRRGPNEQAVLGINAHNQGGRRTGPRTNLTGLQIGSAFPNAPRATRPPPPPPRAWFLRGVPPRKQMTPRATSFTFHQCIYRNGSIVCNALPSFYSVHFPFQSTSALAGITSATLTKNPCIQRFFIPTHLLPQDSIFIKGGWINGRKQHNL